MSQPLSLVDMTLQWVRTLVQPRSAGSMGLLPVRFLGEHSTPSSLGSHESWFKRPTHLLVLSVVLLPVWIQWTVVDWSGSQAR